MVAGLFQMFSPTELVKRTVSESVRDPRIENGTYMVSNVDLFNLKI